MSGLYAGLAFGGIGGFFAEWWGWRYGFQVFGLFGILYSVVLLFFLKDRKEDDTDNTTDNQVVKEQGITFSGSVKALFSERSFIILLFFFCAYGIVNWLVYGWLPTFLKDHFHLSVGQAGISATGYMQIGSLAGVVAGVFLPINGRRRTTADVYMW